jgi:hypothetical protein
MSTRATYRFIQFAEKDRPAGRRPETTVYIHHDGYPSGAAAYLNNALNEQTAGNMATKFIRANRRAEITDSHDQHDDTDYRYDITGSGSEAEIIAYQRVDSGNRCIFSGTLYQFINLHPSCIENHVPFRIVDTGYSKKWCNMTQAKALLDGHVDHLQRWKSKFEGSANWNSCVDKAKEVLKVFPELEDPEITLLIA